MPPITEDTVKKHWAVAAIVAVLVFSGAWWAATVGADVAILKAAMEKQEQALRDTAYEIRLLREAMIRAGTALPPKED